jgi:hypothetical protein
VLATATPALAYDSDGAAHTRGHLPEKQGNPPLNQYFRGDLRPGIPTVNQLYRWDAKIITRSHGVFAGRHYEQLAGPFDQFNQRGASRVGPRSRRRT